MKNLFFSIILALGFAPIIAQEALLSDLLNVQPVEYNEEGNDQGELGQTVDELKQFQANISET